MPPTEENRPEEKGTAAEAQWHRLAPLALATLIVSRTVSFIQQNLYALAGLGAGFAFVEALGPRELVMVLLGLLLLVVGSAVIYHRRFRFRLEEDALLVRRGLFEKKELRLRFARVQNIQIGQPFYFRPFGLVRFSLETPGASEKEVELPGIRRELAVWMRQQIISQTPSAEPAENLEPALCLSEESTLFSASAGRLFLHGLASNQIWFLTAAAAPLLPAINNQLAQQFEDPENLPWQLSRLLEFGWIAAVLILLAVLLSLLLLSGVITVIRFFGYRLMRRGDQMIATAGLLDKREQTLKKEKITGLLIRQSALGRLLGCWSLVARQASSSAQRPESRSDHFLVPGLRHHELTLTSEMLDLPEHTVELQGISKQFQKMYWLRLLLPLLLGWFAILRLPERDAGLLIGLAVVLPVLALAVHLRWRHWGWAMQAELLWVRQGMLGLSMEVFPVRLVQQVRISQSLYQRRHGLASVRLTVPQGIIQIPFLPLDSATELANRAVYSAESSLIHRV